MKYIIGVVGENGAGKDTFTTFFRAAAAPMSVSKLHFSDVLTQTLNLWGISVTRSNLQNLAIIMDRQYGKGSLTRATEARIKKQQADIVVIEGVRWKTDVPMIRSFKNSILVYITAIPKIRFERMRLRGKKEDEAKKTYKQFLVEEKAKTETDIPEIGAKADVKIENNGSLEEFRLKVEEFYDQLGK
jgi:dephospho-CoA kinase